MPQAPFAPLGSFDPNAGRDNPGLSNPAPFPTSFPAQSQTENMRPLGEWSGIAPDPPSTKDTATSRRVIWSPGLWDLHPELGNDKSTDRQAAKPILGGSGLYVFVRILPSGTELAPTFLNCLAITYYERASAWGFNNTFAVTGEQDVSMNLLVGNPPHETDQTPNDQDPITKGMAGMLVLRPPGDAGTIRYWQPYLVFTQWKRMTDPIIFIESGWY